MHISFNSKQFYLIMQILQKFEGNSIANVAACKPDWHVTQKKSCSSMNSVNSRSERNLAVNELLRMYIATAFNLYLECRQPTQCRDCN